MDDRFIGVQHAIEANTSLSRILTKGCRAGVTGYSVDHYENMYAVITGRKIFTLIPPTEQFCLHGKQKNWYPHRLMLLRVYSAPN